MQLEVRHVRILLALVEEKTVTRAAKRLGIPQPALSAQLRRIEQDLGAALFERSSRGVAPTEQGRRLLPHLQAVDHGMRFLERSRASRSPVRRGTLRVGVESWALLDALKESSWLGDTTLQLAMAGPSAVRPALLDAVFDLVEYSEMGDGAVELPRPFRSATVLEEPVGLVVPAGHPLDEAGPVRMADLEPYDWVSYLPGTAWYEALRRACQTAGYSPRIRALAAAEPGLVDLAGREPGLILGAALATRRGRLLLRAIDQRITRRMLLAWNADTCSDDVAEAALDRIRTWYAGALGVSSMQAADGGAAWVTSARPRRRHAFSSSARPAGGGAASGDRHHALPTSPPIGSAQPPVRR